MRKLLKILGIIVAVAVTVVAGVFGWLTLTEYDPADIETVAVTAAVRQEQPKLGGHYSAVTLNVGYGALGRDADFFMDGGKQVQPDSREVVESNMAGMLGALSTQKADVYFLQEVDVNAQRSYHVNETERFARGLSLGSAFACNYKCDYVPYPWPPIGQVESGLQTLNGFRVTEATRESLPCPFSWPVRLGNLKRCLLVERVPIADTERELILINLHLEAYSDPSSRVAQTQQLVGVMKAELQKGNYVIAGGDFNQSFPGAVEKYPLPEDAGWQPGQLSEEDLPAGFTFACDLRTPSCRLLDKPYDGNRTALTVYVIDGFIVSSNVKVNGVETIDLNFQHTDHHPVRLDFTLMPSAEK